MMVFYNRSDKLISHVNRDNSCILPNEILDLILSFYTNQFQGLIHFSTICKQWKEISNCSRIWLKCELLFYSSIDYFLSFESQRLPSPESNEPIAREDVIRVKKAKGDQNIRSIYLFDDHYAYIPRVYKIKVKKVQTHIIGVTQMKETDQSEPLESQLVSAQVKLIRQRFMKIFRHYHKTWDWYAPRIVWLRRQIPLLTLIADRYLQICLLLTPVFLGLSVYLFWNISIENGLSFENHLGFMFLYLFGLQFLGYFILLIPIVIHEQIYEYSYTKNPLYALNSNPFRVVMMILLLIVGALLSVSLWQYALAQQAYSSQTFEFIYVPIPLQIALVFCIVIGGMILLRQTQNTDRITTIIAFTWPAAVIIGILIGFTLLGVCFDTANHLKKSLKSVIICWSPFEFTLLVLFFISIASNIEQIYKMRAVHPVQLHNFIVDLLRTLFIGGMLGSIIYLNILSTTHANESSFLTQSLICLLIWLQCFVSAVYTVAKQE